jgi:hypothetical protein
MGKKSGSGVNIADHFPVSLVTDYLGLNMLKLLDEDPPGSRIRCEHPCTDPQHRFKTVDFSIFVLFVPDIGLASYSIIPLRSEVSRGFGSKVLRVADPVVSL